MDSAKTIRFNHIVGEDLGLNLFMPLFIITVVNRWRLRFKFIYAIVHYYCSESNPDFTVTIPESN